MRVLAAALLAPLLVAACGAGEPGAVGGTTSTADEPPPATAVPPDPDQLYEANATVLDDGEQGPRLCLGAMRLSLPPQCGDVPIANWDWDAVEGEESASGTTWGDYHVVGTYDGDTFTVTESGPSEDDALAVDTTDFSSPCPEPDGGWLVPDPEPATQEHARQASAYATSQPDYVASWVTQLDEERAEFGPVVFNAVFTGIVEHHEAALRKVWEGPLCVVRGDGPTARQLSRIRREVEDGLARLRLQMLWSQGPAVEPAIEIGVIVDPGGAGQAALDERYGPGTVQLLPALRAVEE